MTAGGCNLTYLGHFMKIFQNRHEGVAKQGTSELNASNY